MRRIDRSAHGVARPTRRRRILGLVTAFVGGILIAAVVASVALASSASSTNYRLEEGVVNGFGDTGSSPSYRLTSSGGEPFVGPGSSTTYSVDSGYVAQLVRSITLNLDAGSVGLSPTPGGASTTGQSTISVQTDAGGYSLSTVQDHNLLHTDTVTTIPAIGSTIAAPAAWSEGVTTGLGFTLTSGSGLDPKWGTTPNFNFAAFPGAATSIHTKLNYQAAVDDTVVRYRLAVAGAQKAGAYSNQVTFSAIVAA